VIFLCAEVLVKIGAKRFTENRKENKENKGKVINWRYMQQRSKGVAAIKGEKTRERAPEREK